MQNRAAQQVTVEVRDKGVLAACFVAMASPCEILLDSTDVALAERIGRLAAAEAWRIEQKFSRYRPDSVVSRINSADGQPVSLDRETAALLDYARNCYELSDGMFDITAGVLRRAWRFDGSDRIPDAAQVAALLPCIGFQRLIWHNPTLVLPAGMELDFGGIGKEYAVDRALALIREETRLPVLVNFGGDLCASDRPSTGPWQVGIEQANEPGVASMLLDLSKGALATSGDTRRFLERDGIRYSHILDPHTGWPVAGAPGSVTVAAGTCTEAGLLATLALLKGAGARQLLEESGVQFWCSA
jgi:thiamine biosynthesis lipoprotein